MTVARNGKKWSYDRPYRRFLLHHGAPVRPRTLRSYSRSTGVFRLRRTTPGDVNVDSGVQVRVGLVVTLLEQARILTTPDKMASRKKDDPAHDFS